MEAFQSIRLLLARLLLMAIILHALSTLVAGAPAETRDYVPTVAFSSDGFPGSDTDQQACKSRGKTQWSSHSDHCKLAVTIAGRPHKPYWGGFVLFNADCDIIKSEIVTMTPNQKYTINSDLPHSLDFFAKGVGRRPSDVWQYGEIRYWDRNQDSIRKCEDNQQAGTAGWTCWYSFDCSQ